MVQGETENQLLAFAAAQPAGSVELCVVKPGIITGHSGPSSRLLSVMTGALVGLGIVKKVGIQELVAAMLQQVRDGFEKEPLENDDLIRIGQRVLGSTTAEGTK